MLFQLFKSFLIIPPTNSIPIPQHKTTFLPSFTPTSHLLFLSYCIIIMYLFTSTHFASSPS